MTQTLYDSNRRQKRVGYAALVFILLGGLGICYLGGIFAFFGAAYDFPSRTQGHYEKNVTLGDRAFAISPYGKTVVYSTTETGYGDLWTMDPEGKRRKQLTSSADYESGPCYSPDGRWIVFSRETNKCGHIWIMASDGTGARQLTSGQDYDANPVFTPDGKSLWFQRTPLGTSVGHYKVFTMTSSGQTVQRLNATDPDLGQNACFAPNSLWVYYTQTDYSETPPHQIRRMHLDNTGQQRLVDGTMPAASPNSKQVAFVAGGSENELWRMDADGSHKNLVYHSTGGKRYVSFAADGRRLFFLEETTKGTFLSSVHLDGSDYKRLQDVMPETREKY